MTNLTEFSGLSLQRFENDGIELYIDCKTGESFASKRGYARMANIDESSVRKRIRTADFTLQDGIKKGVKVQTAKGLRSADLITETTISQWLVKDNSELAAKLMQIGVRAFMHKLAGFDITTTAFKPQPSDLEAITRRDLIFLLHETQLDLDKAEEENKVLIQIIEEQAPLVKLAESLTAKGVDTINIGDFGRTLDIGRTTFFEILREIKFIQKKPSTLPYQRHIDAGRAEIARKERTGQPGKFDPYCVLTAKGQEYVAHKLVELENSRTLAALTPTK